MGLTKAMVEFRTLAVELVRLVRIFLEPWDRKESVSGCVYRSVVSVCCVFLSVCLLYVSVCCNCLCVCV